jgi:hypothetical protein
MAGVRVAASPLARSRGTTLKPQVFCKEMAMPDWLNSQMLTSYAINAGTKVLGAIAIWIIGGLIINFIIKLSTNSMNSHKVDAMLIKYVDSSVRVLLRIVLVIAILSVFGIETRSGGAGHWRSVVGIAVEFRGRRVSRAAAAVQSGRHDYRWRHYG